MGTVRHARPISRTATRAAVACALALTLAVATAQAQDPNPTVEEQAKTYDLDTDLTPVAKETDLWSLVHGAEFRKTQVIEGSVTRFDTDLFAVQFQNRTIGLAGGSTCAIEPVQEKNESAAEFGTRVAQCRGTDGSRVNRVPALYRYHEPADGDPGWGRLELPGDAQGQSPGYIGAIAWIDKDRALIVGGTGTYPRRETPDDGRASTDPAKTDEAGKARAWVYRRSTDEVEEVDLSALTAHQPGRAGMRGLTAVDCYVDPTPGLRRHSTGHYEGDPAPDLELCFAGGLGQIWEWRAGKFVDARVDALSPSAELSNPAVFRYRVRDLAFGPTEPPMAVAVTSGCCAQSAGDNVSQTLVYDGDPTWERRLSFAPPPGYKPAPGRWYAGTNFRPEFPDSVYSLTVNKGRPQGGLYDDAIYMSVIASPGGPASAGEDSSIISSTYAQKPGAVGESFQFVGSAQSKPGPFVTSAGSPAHSDRSLQRQDDLRRTLSSTRLLAGDGDVAGTDAYRLSGSGGGGQPTSPDGQPDWAVGELRSTVQPGLGARGLVVATALPPRAEAAINEGRRTAPPPEEVLQGEYQPFNQDKLDAHIRSSHYLLPSYSANAIDIVGDQEDGWAVGDHGAILRLSATHVNQLEGAAEPEAPRLGQPRERRLSDRDAFAEARAAVPSTVGAIPRLGEETIELDEPRIVAGNAPQGQIVMSRDGSEGWAIANDSSGPVLSRFDGTGWSRCEMGDNEAVSPDPACAEVAPLRDWRAEDGTPRSSPIATAARIPLENDADPTNDDELEIAAFVSSYRGPETEGKTQPVVARLSEGRWRIEQKGALSLGDFASVAFTAPDDGWAHFRGSGSAGAQAPARIFHFNGERWADCASDAGGCGNEDGRLPTQARSVGGFEVAGDRIYLYGHRVVGPDPDSSCGAVNATTCQSNRDIPMVIYRDPDQEWTDGSGGDGSGGGTDEGFGADPASPRSFNVIGQVHALEVVEDATGDLQGWAAGVFGFDSPVAEAVSEGTKSARRDGIIGGTPSAEGVLMRLEPGAEGWQRFSSPGPLEDYLLGGASAGVESIVSYPSESHPDGTFIGDSEDRVYGFDSARQRFTQIQSARPQGNDALHLTGFGRPRPAAGGVTAPDNQGGFWSGAFHYTDIAPKPVFTEAPAPLGIRGADLVDLDAAPDGSVWAATNSDRVFRHDRIAGWEEVRVPGWDPGRVVTRPSQATAISIGPDSSGLLVGEGGRIAEFSPEGVALDPAAGRSCALGDTMPCSSSRDLRAVEIAPDGSAIAGGERLALLWRPPGGEFRAIAKPPIASATTITKLAFPTPNRAYLLTDRGIVFRGDLSAPDQWRWRADNVDSQGDLVSLDAQNNPIQVHDLVVSATGHGYAVGDDGLVMERDEETRWRRLPTRLTDDLTAIDVPTGQGQGVLIGGADGLVLAGDPAAPHVASHAEPTNGEVVGFAYLPGASEGSVDAWAGLRSRTASQSGPRLLRYRSDSDDPALAAPRIIVLPDAPPHDADELSLAAFGKSDCEFDEDHTILCPEMTATTTTNELVSQRIVAELAERREAGELDGALQTGDAVDSAGLPASSLADLDRLGSANAVATNLPPAALAGQLKHRRYAEHVTQALEDEGVPAFGAIGANDLTEAYACNGDTGCERTKRLADAGENYGWREGFAGRADPWGDGSDTAAAEAGSELSFEPAPGSEDNSLAIEDQRLDADGEGSAPEAKAEIGGANTHYAVDAIRDGEAIARIVFVDTSLRSLAASDPLQQPHELAGGQLRFLERMICRRGDTTMTAIDECTRGPGQRAIVVSNTPTYSYGPGALTHTATDANVFEALMLKHRVDLVVSGALGLNGLYYTLAPGVHEPCPGGNYPAAPPGGQTPDCLAGPTSAADAVTEHSPAKAPDPASLIVGQGLGGSYPTLIASGAGGKFGPDGGEPADGPAGQWHGYSLARLLSSGDLVVEQRPILDWIGIDAPDHALPPKSRLRLNGYGRSPISTTTTGQRPRAFHYAISTPAITHRYDLVLADPDAPWLPCSEDDINCQELHANLSKPSGEAEGAPTLTGEANPCSPHLCLPSRIGVVDDQSGLIRAGDGKYPETFAIAMLSVDEEVATYPLVFKRSPSFVATPAIRSGALPNTAGTRPTAPPPPPPPPGLPQIPQVDIPQIPPPPGIPQLSAATPPELQPPAPPAPPPPSQQPAPLDLSVAPPGVSISTPTALIQPPTPPVNPAPPGGARREARQRQAAAQKGGADSDANEQAQDGGGDLAQQGPDRATRRDRVKPGQSFTVLTNRDQPSAWATGALYGGGLTILAFTLAAGWTRGRPTPRRRTPDVPATALSQTRWRR